MTIKQAIEKAIEGGYKFTWATNRHLSTVARYSNYYSILFLDPLFWQALGRSLGWGKGRPGLLIYEWLYNWHCFIDHLADGKTIEEYFKNLK